MSKYSRIIAVLKAHNGQYISTRTIHREAGLSVGTEITAPIRRARTKGMTIPCRKFSDCYKYALMEVE